MFALTQISLSKNILTSLKKLTKHLFWYLTHEKPQKGIKNVHLGCGDINFPNFINIDLLPLKHVHYLHGIENLEMFKDDELDLIYTSHCLEHISYTAIESTLEGYYSKLKSGGILRISVPDFDVILKAYQESNRDLAKLLVVLYGGHDYDYNYHYMAFNRTYLENLLKKVGFREIKEWRHDNVWHKDIPDWSKRTIDLAGKTYFISLNIEAIK